MTVCAGGITGAARRERHIGEPAQQAAYMECQETCDGDDGGESSRDTDKVIAHAACWMDFKLMDADYARCSLPRRVHDRGGHILHPCFMYAYWPFKVSAQVTVAEQQRQLLSGGLRTRIRLYDRPSTN